MCLPVGLNSIPCGGDSLELVATNIWGQNSEGVGVSQALSMKAGTLCVPEVGVHGDDTPQLMPWGGVGGAHLSMPLSRH